MLEMFTPLETTLISILIAIVAGWGTFLGMGKRFMTRAECLLYQEKSALAENQAIHNRRAEDKQIKKDVDKLLSTTNLQFRMLREIIVYMDIPAENKTKILNMKPVKDD